MLIIELLLIMLRQDKSSASSITVNRAWHHYFDLSSHQVPSEQRCFVL